MLARIHKDPNVKLIRVIRATTQLSFFAISLHLLFSIFTSQHSEGLLCLASISKNNIRYQTEWEPHSNLCHCFSQTVALKKSKSLHANNLVFLSQDMHVDTRPHLTPQQKLKVLQVLPRLTRNKGGFMCLITFFKKNCYFRLDMHKKAPFSPAKLS